MYYIWFSLYHTFTVRSGEREAGTDRNSVAIQTRSWFLETVRQNVNNRLACTKKMYARGTSRELAGRIPASSARAQRQATPRSGVHSSVLSARGTEPMSVSGVAQCVSEKAVYWPSAHRERGHKSCGLALEDDLVHQGRVGTLTSKSCRSTRHQRDRHLLFAAAPTSFPCLGASEPPRPIWRRMQQARGLIDVVAETVGGRGVDEPQQQLPAQGIFCLLENKCVVLRCERFRHRPMSFRKRPAHCRGTANPVYFVAMALHALLHEVMEEHCERRHGRAPFWDRLDHL